MATTLRRNVRPSLRAVGVRRWSGAAVALGLAAALTLFGGISAAAATAVNLATAAPFAVLAGTSVTSTGNTTISGDVGVDPDASVTGFPPAIVEPPSTTYTADGVALDAQNDLTTAYDQAATGEGSATTEPADLTGLTLDPGVYQTSSDGALSLSGALTLDGEGNPDAVFVFQTGSSLTTGTSSTVSLIDDASPCNVFWQVGSSAALDGPTFAGNVLALTSITVGSAVTVDGRVLARNGDVTLIDDHINASACIAALAAPTPTPSPGTGTPTTGAGGTEGGALLVIGGLVLLGAGAVVATIRRRRWTSPL
ncbi:MAG: ice-binding family protein [Candidatus Dormiibacterota bacterium]|jgi:hypothetical protein